MPGPGAGQGLSCDHPAREAGALQRRPVHRQVRNSPGSLFQVFTTREFHTGHSWEAARPFPKRSLFFFPVFVPFYFLRFFLKNTLLQELENTQKQIEEHQHDKVNAAAGTCPSDSAASLPALSQGHLLLLKCPSSGGAGIPEHLAAGGCTLSHAVAGWKLPCPSPESPSSVPHPGMLGPTSLFLSHSSIPEPTGDSGEAGVASPVCRGGLRQPRSLGP